MFPAHLMHDACIFIQSIISRKTKNPNARGKWYEDWIPGGSQADFAVKAFKKYLQEVDWYMTLADVRDYIASLNITEPQKVYMGKLDVKPDKTIGVYHSKHQHTYKTAIGGAFLESYGTKYVTLLVHWNKSPRDTEKAATALFEALTTTREAQINNETIKFIQPLYEIQDVGTDDSGIYEMVIEAAFIYAKGE